MNKEAINGAKKLCGIGGCWTSFQCDHSNHEEPYMGQLQHVTDICPLTKYHVKPEETGKPWYHRDRKEVEPTIQELDAICKDCEFSGATKEMWLPGEVACLDCPVYLYKEQLCECFAEIATN